MTVEEVKKTVRLLKRHRRWAWWLLLPAVILYLGHRVACQQADLCLF